MNSRMYGALWHMRGSVALRDVRPGDAISGLGSCNGQDGGAGDNLDIS
jgi:hypothetical protein